LNRNTASKTHYKFNTMWHHGALWSFRVYIANRLRFLSPAPGSGPWQGGANSPYKTICPPGKIY